MKDNTFRVKVRGRRKVYLFNREPQIMTDGPTTMIVFYVEDGGYHPDWDSYDGCGGKHHQVKVIDDVRKS